MRLLLAVAALATVLTPRDQSFVGNPSNRLFPDRDAVEARKPRTEDLQALRSATLELRDHAPGWVNVRSKGAIPDDGIPDDAAFIAAMNEAFASTDATKNKGIHLPAGEYLITSANILNLWTAGTPYRGGVTISGDGMFNTTIRFKPATSAWLYDGVAVPGRRFNFFTMRDMRLLFDSGTSGKTVNGLRMNGTGTADQAFEFHRMRIEGVAAHPGTFLKIEGTANGSENKFIAVRGRNLKSVIHSTNAQAVNHYSIGSDWEGMRGRAFDFEAGGQLSVIGGSFIFDGGDSGLLRVSGQVAKSAYYGFYMVRTEMRVANGTLFEIVGPGALVTVEDRLGSHRSQQGGAMTLARMNSHSSSRLTFDHCDLSAPNPMSIVFENSSSLPHWYSSRGEGGRVTVQNSRVRDDLISRVSWEKNAEGGLFRTRDNSTYSAVDGSTPALALDVDMTGPMGWMTARNMNAFQMKSISGIVTRWPNSVAGHEARAAVKLPVGSTVKAIRVMKRTSGHSTSAYQLAATNKDGSHTYGKSAAATRMDQHEIMLENVNRLVTAGVDEEIRITCTAGNCGDRTAEGMVAGDMFIVEYY